MTGVVVGPDEPYGDQGAEGATTGHWNYLGKILAQQVITISADELRAIPHDVVVGNQVLSHPGHDNDPSKWPDRRY